MHIECLLYGRHSSKHFTFINEFNHHTTMKVYCCHFVDEETEAQGIRNVPKVTRLLVDPVYYLLLFFFLTVFTLLPT